MLYICCVCFSLLELGGLVSYTLLMSDFPLSYIWLNSMSCILFMLCIVHIFWFSYFLVVSNIPLAFAVIFNVTVYKR